MEYTLDTWLQIEEKLKSEKKLNEEESRIVSYITKERSIDCYLSKNEICYRARIYKAEDMQQYNRSSKFHGYNEEKSMAPKPGQVTEPGRFNRINESVLYMAGDKYTSLAELRPGKKVFVSIAEIELIEDVKLADLTYKEFKHKENDIDQIFSQMALACFLVVNNDKEKYYVTQYIGQQLKKLKYDGVMYSSSLSSLGKNIMLFDPKKAKANSSDVYQTHHVMVVSQECFEMEGEILYPNATFLKKDIIKLYDKMLRKK